MVKSNIETEHKKWHEKVIEIAGQQDVVEHVGEKGVQGEYTPGTVDVAA